MHRISSGKKTSWKFRHSTCRSVRSASGLSREKYRKNESLLHERKREVKLGAVSSGSGGTRVSDISSQLRDVRKQMDEDEGLSTLMRGLRGANLNADDFADESVRMRLVEVDVQGGGGDATEALPLTYDPERIAQYWGVRPVSVVTRILQLGSIASGFLSGVVWDFFTDKLKVNEVRRARQIREIVTSLGPAYIKLGQALSIRPDLLSPAAMNELQKLCDKVPSFDSGVAMALLEQELGRPWHAIYDELSAEPVAAASLGQVYKGTLPSGEVVAVKVQRPYVLETVTIDLFIIRRLTLELRKFPAISTDFVALLDEWAERFFEELDYVNEGNNATKFADMMKDDLPQVVVPKTYHEFTSRRVLTSEWIEGEKLSQSTEDDVGSLVNVGVICYLKQLLDTGFFHADPHPGNMIRTPDGRLAILDFGLMTQIDDSIKFGMIEAIAHLIHRDYEGIVGDFVTLDFIPEGVNLKPILPVLAKVFDQALDGGGAKNINFQELAADLAQITFDYPFRIPPYFALIIRAISVLEGIALVGNPDFAIVDEAYPYISKRLLTDESPRLRSALKYIVYGKNNTFDAERLIDILQAFEDYGVASKLATGSSQTDRNSETGVRLTARAARIASSSQSSSSSSSTAGPMPAAAAAGGGDGNGRNTRAREEALNFIFSKDGKFFRELMMDELVKAVDALSRESFAQLIAQMGLSSVQIPLLVPFAPRPTLPLTPVVSEQDQLVARNVTMVVSFLLGQQQQSAGTGASGIDPALVRELAQYAPAMATEILPELNARLMSRLTARVIRDVYGVVDV